MESAGGATTGERSGLSDFPVGLGGFPFCKPATPDSIVVGADETESWSPKYSDDDVTLAETEVDKGEMRPLALVPGEEIAASSSGSADAEGSAVEHDFSSSGLTGLSTLSSLSLSGSHTRPRRGLYVPLAIFQQRWQPTMFSPSRISTAVNMRRHSSIPGRCPSFAQRACALTVAGEGPPTPTVELVRAWWSSEKGFPADG